MENPTYIALSRMLSQQRMMDVVANNVANSDTPGFKAEHVQFSDWLLKARGTAGDERTLAFSQDRATWRDLSPGTLTHTGEPLDLALGGDGYFSVKTGNGVRLTRAGRFTVGTDGTIQDVAGHPLLDDGGNTITVSASTGEITVAADGTISSGTSRIGKVGIVNVSDPGRLSAEGSHLFRADAPTSTLAAPRIVQGALEGSNVVPVLEMTRMMQTEREFQFVSQFVQGEGDRQQSAIDTLTAAPQT